MNREDFDALRTPLIALAAALVVGFVLIYYSSYVVETAQRRLTQRESQLRDARTRIRNTDQEKEMIGRYLPAYQQLAQSGFVGDEQRINWLDGLRVANQEARIFGVDYEISAQRPYPYAAEFNPGQLHVQESVMHLRLRLLHEEDLPRFFQALGRQSGGFFALDQCVIKRIKPGEGDKTATVQPNLLADCEVSWLTVQPPASAEKKKG